MKTDLTRLLSKQGADGPEDLWGVQALGQRFSEASQHQDHEEGVKTQLTRPHLQSSPFRRSAWALENLHDKKFPVQVLQAQRPYFENHHFMGCENEWFEENN